jgi:predicted Zn-dependent peptidase
VFCSHRLDNGLEIIAECSPQAYTSALGFFVRSGSRDETDDEWGVSHFLEHMAFKGTPSRSADDVNLEFDAMGAVHNAFTSEEATVYHAAILPEMQDRAVRLLADIMRPALRDDDFQTEKKVIIEEIQMYDDQPPFGAFDRARAMHYGTHPLGRSVLGTAASITNLPVEAMRDYFHRRYSPGNMTLAASGRIDFDVLVRTIEELCGSWPSLDAPRDTPPSAGAGKYAAICKPSAVQQYIVQVADGPSATDPLRYAAGLLSIVLGDESGSRFYWELVESGLAEHASFSLEGCQGTGAFWTYVTCEPTEAEANLERLDTIVSGLIDGGVTADELEQAKNKIASRVVLRSERPRNRLFAVGGTWLDERLYRTVAEELERIRAVTLDDLNAVLALYPLDRRTTLSIGPLAEIHGHPASDA